MKATAKSVIEEIRAFINIHDYVGIELKEEYSIGKNLYEVTTYEGASDIIEDYLDYLYDNLSSVLNLKCCSIIENSDCILKVVHPIFIDIHNIPKDFITLYVIKVLNKCEIPVHHRLYMFDDGRRKKVSESFDEIIEFSIE